MPLSSLFTTPVYVDVPKITEHLSFGFVLLGRNHTLYIEYGRFKGKIAACIIELYTCHTDMFAET